MIDDLQRQLGTVQPLKRRVDPNMAAVIGFLFGGIGLGIYMRSFIDFVLPIVMVMFLGAILSELGWVAGPLFAAVYGYYRAVSSNRSLPV